jgi:hypothetical protein
VCVGGLAILLVLLQFAGLAHFLLVQHEICPEHNELVHGHAPWTEPYGAAPDATSSDALSQAEAGAGGSEHGHCSVFLHQRARTFVPLTLGVAALREGAALGVADRAPPPLSVAVLFFAPKNSPPSC